MAEYSHGVILVILTVFSVTAFFVCFGSDYYLSPFENLAFGVIRYEIFAVSVTFLLLNYFKWRSIVLSPAIYEARLQALQARIRPHFLFNCLNTVISLIRSDPRKAETALEDMSDLFRMAMSADNHLVPLKDEIDLAKRYLALEQLRLSARLRANWRMENVPTDALIPPLILQPLLENAVYHGIEPLTEGGAIEIHISLLGSEIHIEIYNPCPGVAGNSRHSNKLALANIRERLSLLFDFEASYSVNRGDDFYQVHIVIPYINERPS